MEEAKKYIEEHELNCKKRQTKYPSRYDQASFATSEKTNSHENKSAEKEKHIDDK